MRIRTAIIVLLAGCCLAERAPAQPAFEVASVRPHQTTGRACNGTTTMSGPRLTITCYSVSGLIMFAYGVKMDQISSTAPMDHTMLDVAASAAEGRTPDRDEFRLMMKSLLADRFQLKAHLETRDVPVYALVVDKGGPRFKESPAGADPTPKLERDGPNSGVTLNKGTMDAVADWVHFNAGLDRPVINRTGLKGTYQLTLTFTPERRSSHGLDANEISIYTAVRDQLGLRLEPQRASREYLVIDRIGKPSEN